MFRRPWRRLGSREILSVNKQKSCTFVVIINQSYGSNKFQIFECWDADIWCMWFVCAVKSLFAIRQAFQDPQNALASWDANYMSPCTFAYVECDPESQSVVRLYEHKSLKFHCFVIFWFIKSIQCSFTSDLISIPPTSEDWEREREREKDLFCEEFLSDVAICCICFRELPSQSLAGTLSPAIGNLSNLQHL